MNSGLPSRRGIICFVLKQITLHFFPLHFTPSLNGLSLVVVEEKKEGLYPQEMDLVGKIPREMIYDSAILETEWNVKGKRKRKRACLNLFAANGRHVNCL